ncbi:hypothetical protein HDA32_001136 [Spinactinospora alkalitolerans]|uniref:GmrSD restriction endonucleases N-terminal domain-containing protein n=1 Tax=Spinactinospora alkalitolerans TaxID=687207 RepID=A0A852TNT6_9ACTN|nr:DUF262 domain-containing protein [Spinactinospora alkalitolerans]NYE46016.1 hypothetical protein [Spinactinospora alkalitolerans]
MSQSAPGADAPDEASVPLDQAGYSSDIEMEQMAFDGFEPEAPTTEISDPFDPEQINVKTKTMTVDLMLSRLRRKVLFLNPDFQRNAGIWNQAKQSQLIESLLLRIPLPTFYAAETNAQESWEMVDGVQRLTTISRFIEPELVGEPPLVLKGLQYLRKLNGLTYDQLPGGLKTRLHETEFVVHVIGLGTPEEVKFNIFARINTGGMPLTLQELRHALNPGKARELLGELAAAESFQLATLGRVSDKRMSDREMVLRFLAFRLSNPSDYRAADLDEFLREAMSDINHLPDDQIDALRQEFDHAMDASRAIFGDNAFRKQVRGKDRLSPINKALFETVAVNLATRSAPQIAMLRRNSQQVNDGLISLLENVEFDRAISMSTGDNAKVRLRFALVDALFEQHQGDVDA